LMLSFAGIGQRWAGAIRVSIDGAGFSACASPVAYDAHPRSSYVRSARRRHVEQRGCDTGTFHLTVDAAPNTSITSAVDSRGKPIANGGTTTSGSVTFQGTDNGTIAGLNANSTRGNSHRAAVRSRTRFRERFHKPVSALDNNGFRRHASRVQLTKRSRWKPNR
jgi:hypothetical protein